MVRLAVFDLDGTLVARGVISSASRMRWSAKTRRSANLFPHVCV